MVMSAQERGTGMKNNSRQWLGGGTTLFSNTADVRQIKVTI